MQSQNNQIGRLDKYSRYVTSFTVIFVVLFGFYALGLVNRFTAIDQSWQQYTSRMAKINDELSKLHSAFGYGGLIHHFKNYVIRKDPRYLDLINHDIQTLQASIEHLAKDFRFQDELAALKTIQLTISEYESKLLMLTTSQETLIKERDSAAKVNDEQALKAISLLKERTYALNIKQQQDTNKAFMQAMQWMYLGSFIFVLILLFAYLLMRLISSLKAVHNQLSNALEDSNTLMVNAPDAMVSVTEEGLIKRCNLQMEALFGYSKSELIGKNLSLLLPAETIQTHQKNIVKYFAKPTNRAMAIEKTPLYGQHKNKQLIPIEVNLSSSIVSGVQLSTATIRDVSARIEVENKLKKSIAISEANYTALKQAQISLGETQMTNMMLEKLPIGTILYSFDGKVLVANERILQDTNYTRTELIALNFEDFLEFEKTEDQVIFNKITAKQAAKTDRSLTMLAKLKPKHEQNIPVELNISIYQYRGHYYRLITYINLSDLLLIQNRLVKSHEQLGRAVTATEDGIWEWNIADNSVNFSPQLMKMIGIPNESKPEFSHWYNHVHPDYRPKVDRALAQHFETHAIYEIEYLGLNEQGQYNWFVSKGNSIVNKDNKATLMSGSLRNIHKSKLLEIETAEKTQFLNTIYEGSSHAIWVLNVEENDEFRYLAFNRTACNIVGIEEAAIKNKTLTDITPSIFHPESTAKFRDNYASCANNAKHVQYIESTKFKDVELWYQTDLYPIFDTNNQVTKIVGTSVDISNQKRVEIELAHNKVFLEKIINSAICGLYLYDLKQKTNLTINARYSEILGYNLDDLNQAHNDKDFYHPDDQVRALQHLTKVSQATATQVFENKFRFRHKKGHWVWCNSFDSIVKFDQDGQPELMLGTFVDITEQTLLLAKLQDSNEYLENFAFVASHDLQEPLRKITAFTSSLSQRLAEQRASDEHIEFEFSRLVSASERMRDMIKDLLKLSRINTSELDISLVSITDILNNSIDLLSHLIEDQQAQISLHNTDYMLKVDKGLFIQLFQNLIANSIKFKNKDKYPLINISLVNKAEEIEITYSDNGIGVAPKFVEQIFEPFRRLHSKEQYPGSGIGLALCRQIMAIHKGRISCTSNVSEGCEFKIVLPKVNS